jgi:hypothetical protein
MGSKMSTNAGFTRVNVTIRWCLSATFMVCLQTCLCARIAKGQSPSQELAGTLLAGLRNHVEHLKSGIAEIEVLDKNGAVVSKRFVAFDVNADKMRSDTEVLFDGRIVKVIQTKRDFLQFVTQKSEDGGRLTRLNPGEKPHVMDGMPVDVRAVGLWESFGLWRGGRAEDILNSLEKSAVFNAVLEKDIGMIVLDDIENKQSTTPTIVWIDTAHDYVPVRSEVRVISPGHSFTRQQVETSWGQVNNTWVPLRSISRLFGLDGAATQVDDVRLTWKSVNKGIPEVLFTEEGLKLPTGTSIVDTRLGTPILEKVIGLDQPRPKAPTYERASPASAITVIVCAAVLFTLAVGALTLRRRRKL